MIYFDNAATTKPCGACVEAMTQALTEQWGNPSAQYHFGVETARLLRKCRADVAQALGGETDRVFFTAGGTEADNWAIFATAERLGKRGKHIVTTAVEHSAIRKPLAKLQEQGFEVDYLQPDAQGRITVEDLQKVLRKDTILVSIMMVNNESGAVMPIERMAKLTHRLCPNALFHTDAVQGFFKIPFRASALDADMISVSAHKIHGCKGAGAIYLRPGLKLPPLLLGGGQEGGLRSGTEGLPQIAGFAAACRENLPHRMEHIAHQNKLKTILQEGLRNITGVELLGAQEAPHIVNMAVSGIRSQGLLNKLQDHGICVSAGSACSKGHRSHVMEAMGVAPDLIDGSIRVSLSHENTEEEVNTFLSLLPGIIAELQGK
ncbi:MAG: cysteine desulfurase [Oscillospiraceae bacterium]|nr:cysteine desulfurase [Oscillospiraceae bacterium]